MYVPVKAIYCMTVSDMRERGGEISVAGKKENELQRRYRRTNYGRVVTDIIEKITFN